MVPIGLMAPRLFFALFVLSPPCSPGRDSQQPLSPEIMIKLGGNNDVTKGQLICLHQ